VVIGVTTPQLPLLLTKTLMSRPHASIELIHTAVDVAVWSRNMVGSLLKNPRFSTKHEKVRGLQRARVRGATLRPDDFRQNQGLPFLTSIQLQAAQRVAYHMIVLLNNPISLRVV